MARQAPHPPLLRPPPAAGISGCVRFRGQYNRPNLLYEQQPKAAGFADSVAQVAAFVRERHPRDSGIVYCFSRKVASVPP